MEHSCVHPTGGTGKVLLLVGVTCLLHLQAIFHFDFLSECLYVGEYQENDAELLDSRTSISLCCTALIIASHSWPRF